MGNLVEVSMNFQSSKASKSFGEIIHERLMGESDYVDSEIVLNYDNERKVELIVGDGCKGETLRKVFGDEIGTFLWSLKLLQKDSEARCVCLDCNNFPLYEGDKCYFKHPRQRSFTHAGEIVYEAGTARYCIFCGGYYYPIHECEFGSLLKVDTDNTAKCNSFD